MIIDNATAISYMKKDMEYFYYDIVDIKYMQKKPAVFADTPEKLLEHDFVIVKPYDGEVYVCVYTENADLISEAVSFARETGIPDIVISAEKGADITFLGENISPEVSQKGKHFGIFGAIERPDQINASADISISAPTQSDIDAIAALPPKEWAFLPQRIKFIKNILIAKKDGALMGYLVYDSVSDGHYDIIMLYTHTNARRKGTASALVKAFAEECMIKNGVPYYVCAASEASARLALSLGIPQMRAETVIYKLKQGENNG